MKARDFRMCKTPDCVGYFARRKTGFMVRGHVDACHHAAHNGTIIPQEV